MLTDRMLYINLQALFLRNLLSLIGIDGAIQPKCINIIMLVMMLACRSICFVAVYSVVLSPGIYFQAHNAVSFNIFGLPPQNKEGILPVATLSIALYTSSKASSRRDVARGVKCCHRRYKLQWIASTSKSHRANTGIQRIAAG